MNNTQLENLVPAIQVAVAYTAVTSAGYIVAIFLAWALLGWLARKRRRRHHREHMEHARPPGHFGKLMLILEAVDSIPEAMIIAAATVDGRMTVAFAASIFFLNIVNTMAIALDYLATRHERLMHRVMVMLLFFSVGSLVYSVSSAVFEGFVANVRRPDVSVDYMLLLPTFGGVSCGVALTWLILLVEDRLRRTLPPSADAIQLLQSALQEEERLFTRTTTPTMGISDNDEREHNLREEIRNYHAERILQLETRLSALVNARHLSETLPELDVADEARQVVEETLVDQIDDMNPTLDVHFDIDDGEQHSTRRCAPLHARALKLIVIMFLIIVWTILLTLAFVPVFFYLESPYMDALVNGLSGGAFLSIISSAMIPRIQQDAYRAHWSTLTTRMAGTVAFIAGILTAFALELIPAPGQ